MTNTSSSKDATPTYFKPSAGPAQASNTFCTPTTTRRSYDAAFASALPTPHTPPTTTAAPPAAKYTRHRSLSRVKLKVHRGPHNALRRTYHKPYSQNSYNFPENSGSGYCSHVPSASVQQLYAGHTTGTYNLNGKQSKHCNIRLKSRYNVMALLVAFLVTATTATVAAPHRPASSFDIKSTLDTVDAPWCASQWVYGYEDGQQEVRSVTEGIYSVADCQLLCAAEDECDFWELTYTSEAVPECRLKSRTLVNGALHVILDGNVKPTPEVEQYCNYQLDKLCNSGHYTCAKCPSTAAEFRCAYWSANSVSGPKTCGEYPATASKADMVMSIPNAAANAAMHMASITGAADDASSMAPTDNDAVYYTDAAHVSMGHGDDPFESALHFRRLKWSMDASSTSSNNFRRKLKKTTSDKHKSDKDKNDDNNSTSSTTSTEAPPRVPYDVCAPFADEPTPPPTTTTTTAATTTATTTTTTTTTTGTFFTSTEEQSTETTTASSTTDFAAQTATVIASATVVGSVAVVGTSTSGFFTGGAEALDVPDIDAPEGVDQDFDVDVDEDEIDIDIEDNKSDRDEPDPEDDHQESSLTKYLRWLA